MKSVTKAVRRSLACAAAAFGIALATAVAATKMEPEVKDWLFGWVEKHLA